MKNRYAQQQIVTILIRFWWIETLFNLFNAKSRFESFLETLATSNLFQSQTERSTNAYEHNSILLRTEWAMQPISDGHKFLVGIFYVKRSF